MFPSCSRPLILVQISACCLDKLSISDYSHSELQSNSCCVTLVFTSETLTLPQSAFQRGNSDNSCVSLQLYGRRAAWEDPAAWVIDTYPWSATPTPAEWPPLLQLRPEDVGFDGYSAPREGVRKEPPQSDSDADPLVSTDTHEEEHKFNEE